MISGDAHGLWAGELSHAIERAHADRDLGRLRVNTSRPRAPDESRRHRERSAGGIQAFVCGDRASCSSVPARWQKPDRAGFVQSPAGRVAAGETQTAAGRRDVGHARKCGRVDPHRDVTSVDQAGVVRCPVFDAVARLRLTRPAAVPAHLLGKNRKSQKESELLREISPGSLRAIVTENPSNLCNNACGLRSTERVSE
ncbi:hypothetical protein BamMEX5DRAFT_2589 [Burkholderia ambifaria MEX-5]|uniref:Uncharacterized protein n=1 Tax=Burkholderia ambifaria MEX-5 TaxID=396597 RepID=B1T473_9BURK|nr:hypothetical protein BamMEX5DRAFT_2589 [Burkholderia ambifaria MEX-5]